MTTLAFTLAAMALLQPRVDHQEIGEAIAAVVDDERPLFVDDDDRRRTAAFIVAVGFRESSFRNNILSKTNDACFLQINSRPDLAKDPVACVRVGLQMMRESFRICPAHPLAFYAVGLSGCVNDRAQRISRDRMAVARWLLSHVHEDGV